MKQDTTRIWRVETRGDGFGPYCWGVEGPAYDVQAQAMSFIDSGDDNHPGTYRDPLIAPFFKWEVVGDNGEEDQPFVKLVGRQFRHGFRSVDAMLNWFHSCSLDALLAAGFIVREYELPLQNVIHGTYQSIFDHSKAIASSVFAEHEPDYSPPSSYDTQITNYASAQIS